MSLCLLACLSVVWILRQLKKKQRKVAQVAERQHLRSASRNLLVAPRFQLNTYGRRAFAATAPATWNSLSDELRNPDLHSATYLPTQLKDVSVSTIPGALSALEALSDYALYKPTFTFTLHYITFTFISHSSEPGPGYSSALWLRPQTLRWIDATSVMLFL